MEYRTIGSSDLQVSVVGLGCNNFGMRIGVDGAQAVVDKAIDLGVNFFDTAEMYAGEHGPSEEILGKVLGDRRNDVIVATKFGMPTQMSATGINSPGSGSREYITNALTTACSGSAPTTSTSTWSTSPTPKPPPRRPPASSTNS